MDRTTDLRKRGEKSVLVKKQGVSIEEDVLKNFIKVETMDPLIEEYRETYSQNLGDRLLINEERLPESFALPALLNPVFGTRAKVVGSGLMTSDQYRRARQALLSQMQDHLDKKYPPVESSDSSASEDSEDSESDEEVPDRVNTNHARAEEELSELQRWSKKKYLPKVAKSTARVLVGNEAEISIGPVEGRGKDLPSGNNLFDYVDKKGRFDTLAFFSDHKKTFPTLWIFAQKNASRRVVEVGCERFFGLAGYISSPRRTRLNVRTYERLAMLGFMVHRVYIDIEWVAREYLRRCKAGAWKKENTEEALKCWNLERIIDAESMGLGAPTELTLNDLLNEEESEGDGSDDEE